MLSQMHVFVLDCQVYGETQEQVLDVPHWKFAVGQQSPVVEQVSPFVPTI